MLKVALGLLAAFVVRDTRVSETIIDEPTRLSLVNSWRALTQQPPALVDDGYFLTFATADAIVDMLEQNVRDMEVLDELYAIGVDPATLAFVRLSSAPADMLAEKPGALGLKPGLFQDAHDGLLRLDADPDAPVLDEVELWLGCNSPETALQEPSVSVLFLVGIEGDQTRHLIVGSVGEVVGERYVREPAFFVGGWMYQAFEDKTPIGPAGGNKAFEPAVAKKKLKAKAKNFANCFRNCIRSMCPGLTFIQLACILPGILLCIPSGPGYPLCLQAVMIACTGLSYGGAAILCAFQCA